MKSILVIVCFIKCLLISIVFSAPVVNVVSDVRSITINVQAQTNIAAKNNNSRNQKREDSVDRAQDAQIGGALRGFVVPDIFGMIPASPLGGQPPDDD